MLPGSDADLVIVDMKQRRRIRNDELVTACAWSPFDGYEVAGIPVLSAVRGEIVIEEGVIVVSEGLGTFVPWLAP